MTRDPVRAALRGGGVTALAALLGAALLLAAPSPTAAITLLRDTALVRGTAATDLGVGSAVAPTGALVAAATLLAWLAAAWLLLTLALTLGSRCAGWRGRLCAALLTRATPLVLRRAVAVALGVGLGLGGAGVATAAAPGPSYDWPGISAPPAVAATPTVPSTRDALGPPPPPVASTVLVAPGDSLWSIAEAHLDEPVTAARTATAWPTWWSANRDVIGDDPGLLHPGQVLHAPSTPPG